MNESNTEIRLKRVITALVHNGLKIEEFANATGTYKQNISAFMNGRRNAQIHWLEVAVVRYRTNPDWLLTGKGDMFPAKQSIFNKGEQF